MGADYSLSQGSHVQAVAEGTVVLAEDQFYPGDAMYIDHGGGLISMYFHLSEIKVMAGQEVKKGDTVGLVGTTGRSTGAHLFFGVRWHNARINPQFLLDRLKFRPWAYRWRARPPLRATEGGSGRLTLTTDHEQRNHIPGAYLLIESGP